MAVANDKRKFVFLAEPHTASRAMRDALLKVEGSYKTGSHHMGMDSILNYRRLHRKRGHYTTFCVVRNPADIMVTLWMQSRTSTEGKTLAERIRIYGVQKLDPFFFKHASTADVVLRYENLQEELDCLLHKLLTPTVRLDVVGQTGGKVPWFRYYTPADLGYMLSAYPEIAHWGYTEAIQRQIDAKNRKQT